VSARPDIGSVAVGDEIPQLRKIVTREDLKAYADAGGDQNPLHKDDDFARSVGFPGIIAHGMFTMAHAATCVTNWLGDPGALERMHANFRAPAYLGDELVAGGRITELDKATRRAKLEVWVTIERDGETEWPVKRGSAEIRLS
jgi:acyl dehydratase